MHFQLNPSVSPFLPMNNNADKANASEVLNSNSGYVNSNSKSKIINYANSNSFHINTLLRRIPPPPPPPAKVEKQNLRKTMILLMG